MIIVSYERTEYFTKDILNILKEKLKSITRYEEYWESMSEHKYGEYILYDDIINLIDELQGKTNENEEIQENQQEDTNIIINKIFKQI